LAGVFHFSASNVQPVSGFTNRISSDFVKNGQKRKSHTPPLNLFCAFFQQALITFCTSLSSLNPQIASSKQTAQLLLTLQTRPKTERDSLSLFDI